MQNLSPINKIDDIEFSYNHLLLKRYLFLIILSCCIVGFMGIATTIGFIDLSAFEVYSVIINQFVPNCFKVSDEAQIVVWNIRLSRIILGILSGMGLGIAGAVMQVVLRNPLASPYTLGISAAAAFGAAIAIVIGQGLLGNYLIAGNAFVFAMISSMVILLIAKWKGATPGVMILSGIAVSYFFSACTIILQYFATPTAATEITFWTVGSLSRASWDKLNILFPILLICIPLLIWKSWDFDMISLGDEAARSLGINVSQLRSASMIASSLIVASVVSFIGTVGFIGLISPHITRMIIGADNRFVLPGSALVGGLLLAGADLLAQQIMPPVILPVGVLTAFLGIPLFVYLIMRSKKDDWW